MILAGDVGGTNLRLALYARDGDAFVQVRAARYATAAFERLEQAIDAFFASMATGPIEAAAIGVAAPVLGTTAKLTNSALRIDARAVSAALGGAPTRLLNDLEASALGVPLLPASSFAWLLPGAPDGAGNIAIIAAGTGLGEALLIWDGKRHLAVATEGGHSDFAPRTPLEQALLAAVWAAGDAHASYENVLSGTGLGMLYRFLEQRGEHAPAVGCEPARSPDANRAITDAALVGGCRLCGATLELFCSIYGAEAGNLALKSMARGGVVLAGGIAPRILPLLRGPAFREAFLDKGRFRSLMETIPVSVCLDGDAGLLGAARAALEG